MCEMFLTFIREIHQIYESNEDTLRKIFQTLIRSNCPQTMEKSPFHTKVNEKYTILFERIRLSPFDSLQTLERI